MKYLILAVLIIAACVAPQQTQPEQQPEPQQVPAVEPEPEPEPIIELKTKNDEVVKLFEKMDQVKSYTFNVAVLPEESTNKKYFVIGDKARVDLVSGYQTDGWTGDRVIVDYEARTATLYCVEYHGCKEEGRKKVLDFEEFGVPRPESWVEQISYGEIVGRQTYDRKDASVIEWEEDGLYYRALVENYYGFPLKVTIASDPDFTNIVGGVIYGSLGTNNVKAEDIEAPY